jgi:hypothetical protein
VCVCVCVCVYRPFSRHYVVVAVVVVVSSFWCLSSLQEHDVHVARSGQVDERSVNVVDAVGMHFLAVFRERRECDC